MPKPSKKTQTHLIQVPKEVAADLPSLTANQGGWQTPYQYMAQTLKLNEDGGYVARVRASDLEQLKEFALTPDAGTYERRALQILEYNGIKP
jgi:hypothetical protein